MNLFKLILNSTFLFVWVAQCSQEPQNPKPPEQVAQIMNQFQYWDITHSRPDIAQSLAMRYHQLHNPPTFSIVFLHVAGYPVPVRQQNSQSPRLVAAGPGDDCRHLRNMRIPEPLNQALTQLNIEQIILLIHIYTFGRHNNVLYLTGQASRDRYHSLPVIIRDLLDQFVQTNPVPTGLDKYCEIM